VRRVLYASLERQKEVISFEVVLEALQFSLQGRHRAESFCLSFFRRAGDPVAIGYVAKRWARHPDRAREYALYLNRFAQDAKHALVIDKMIRDSAEAMLEYQSAWAAFAMRLLKKVSPELLTLAFNMHRHGSQSEVVRSLLTYTVCAHASAQRKKEVRDGYGTAPTLVQLAIIHCGNHFTAGERNALMNTAQAHGEFQALMCEAFKAEQKAA
jgi:hypothetical protein